MIFTQILFKKLFGDLRRVFLLALHHGAFKYRVCRDRGFLFLSPLAEDGMAAFSVVPALLVLSVAPSRLCFRLSGQSSAAMILHIQRTGSYFWIQSPARTTGVFLFGSFCSMVRHRQCIAFCLLLSRRAVLQTLACSNHYTPAERGLGLAYPFFSDYANASLHSI